MLAHGVLRIRCACGGGLAALVHAVSGGALWGAEVAVCGGRLLGLDLRDVGMGPGRPAAEQARRLVSGAS